MLPDLVPLLDELERLRRGVVEDEPKQLELEVPFIDEKREEEEDCEVVVDYEVHF